MLRRAFLRRMVFAGLATWFLDLPLPSEASAEPLNEPEGFVYPNGWQVQVRAAGSGEWINHGPVRYSDSLDPTIWLHLEGLGNGTSYELQIVPAA